mgnify:CR=1 FL=1
MSSSGPDSMNIQIVGLIEDAKYSEVKDTIPPVFYTPWHQDSRVGFINFYVKTSTPPEQILRSIPTVMKRLDPGLPLEGLKTMPQQIRENVFLDRMISILSASFAVLATLLAAVGLYGVLAYTVAQRTREIGVRMALGADAGRVRALVMRQVGVMLIVGSVIGIAAAVGPGPCCEQSVVRTQGARPGGVHPLGAGADAGRTGSGIHPGSTGITGRSDPGASIRVGASASQKPRFGSSRTAGNEKAPNDQIARCTHRRSRGFACERGSRQRRAGSDQRRRPYSGPPEGGVGHGYPWNQRAGRFCRSGMPISTFPSAIVPAIPRHS